ncbi:MAG: hypothetical protein AABZ14_08285 [Candidatus Margulisiibacteriota bacterium]
MIVQANAKSLQKAIRTFSSTEVKDLLELVVDDADANATVFRSLESSQIKSLLEDISFSTPNKNSLIVNANADELKKVIQPKTIPQVKDLLVLVTTDDADDKVLKALSGAQIKSFLMDPASTQAENENLILKADTTAFTTAVNMFSVQEVKSFMSLSLNEPSKKSVIGKLSAKQIEAFLKTEIGSDNKTVTVANKETCIAMANVEQLKTAISTFSMDDLFLLLRQVSNASDSIIVNNLSDSQRANF